MYKRQVLALLLTAWLGAATLLWAAGFATTLLRHWDLASGARRQIELERRTHLVATLLTLVMGAQAVALPLMVFNADRTAPLLVGAMCAFGSFNASVYGFPALYAKPVSYTHLDVYKRQGRGQGGGLQHRADQRLPGHGRRHGDAAQASRRDAPEAQGRRPVSYTHLDVYKRQV